MENQVAPKASNEIVNPHESGYQYPGQPKMVTFLTFIAWAIGVIGIFAGIWMIDDVYIPPATTAATIMSFMITALMFYIAGAILSYLHKTSTASEFIAINLAAPSNKKEAD